MVWISRKKQIGIWAQEAKRFAKNFFVSTAAEEDIKGPDKVASLQRESKTASRNGDIRYSLKVKPDYKATVALLQSENPFKATEILKENMDESFVECLLLIIDEQGRKDAEVYKAAGVDRRLFSKIVSDRTYRPSKDTCIAFVLALELGLDDTNRLLERAGYILSHSIQRDLIIEYCICAGVRKVMDVNDILYRLGEKPLGRQ